MGYEVEGAEMMSLEDKKGLSRKMASSPSEWAGLAQEAEKEERWGDAHHYWSAGSEAYTGNKWKSKAMKINAFKVFEKWLENL